MPKYIRKTPQIAQLFHTLKKNGRKVFLLTNSEYYYTKAVMSFLLGKTNMNE